MKDRRGMRGIVRAAMAVFAIAVGMSLAAGTASAAEEFGLEQFAVGSSDTQAGAPADFTTTIGFNLMTYPDPPLSFFGEFPAEDVERIALELPPGLIAAAAKAPACTREQLANNSSCPIETQVGNAVVLTNPLFAFEPPVGVLPSNPIYNLEPRPGEPASLGLAIGAGRVPATIDIGVRNDGDYGVNAVSANLETTIPINSLEVTLWGVPADPAHDPLRWNPAASSVGVVSPAPPTPFMVNPTDCEATPATRIEVAPYAGSGPAGPSGKSGPVGTSAEAPKFTGCDKLTFNPTIKATPETTTPDTPTGMAFDLAFPQNEEPYGLATPALRDAVVDLPTGMGINPGEADGLGACTDAQLGIGTPDAAACPDAAKIGSVSLQVPALRHPLDGSVYIGSQESDDPASGKMFRIFLVADGQGIHFKLEGAVRVDPATGQVRTTFDDNPQVPVSAIHLAFKGGPRAVLVNPPTCGPKTVDAHLTSWGGPAADVSSTFQVDCTPGLGSFAPGLQAGTADHTAGSFSPFTLRVTRGDGQQNLSTISATLPEGLLAKLAGVPLCGEAQAATGDCPAASQVGTTTVGTGAGSAPLYVPQAGKAPTAIYLAGPYRGAPYSLVVKVPAQAGPFDLGTVTVRNTINVDPTTAQVSVKSDPLPQILKGIPIAYRDIRVDVNRDQFTINPTSCDPMEVKGTIGSSAGTSANVSDRFQVASCEALGFKPSLKLSVKGATHRNAHPALKAVLTMPDGANIDKAKVTLPKTELLENAHIRTICTRVQYAAGSGGGSQCPAASIYGKAKAWSPLLDKPLEGPVYLRSSDHQLPDLVASLDGQIHIDLVGRIDAVNARIRNTFEGVPDAPVSRFVLEMQGGKKGLLANNTELCKTTPRATVAFDAHSGKLADSNPVMKADCGKARKGAKQRSAHKR